MEKNVLSFGGQIHELEHFGNKVRSKEVSKMTQSTWTGTNQDTQYLSKELGLGSVVKKDEEEGGGAK